MPDGESRLAALDPKLIVELYEHDPAPNILEKIDPRRAGNLDTWLVPHRDSEALLKQARPALDPIVALAPQAVTRHPATPSREVYLRYRGLPFARWDDGRVFFGINEASEELNSASRPALKHLLRDLEVHRQPLAGENIVLNLSGLQYLDSSGIGELAKIYVSVVKDSGQLKVVGLSPKAQEILKITQLYQVFPEFRAKKRLYRVFPNAASMKPSKFTNPRKLAQKERSG